MQKQIGQPVLMLTILFVILLMRKVYRKILMEKPEDVESAAAQVFHFGQTPVKLFNKEHGKGVKNDEDYIYESIAQMKVDHKEIDVIDGDIVNIYPVDRDLYGIFVKNREVFINRIPFTRKSCEFSHSVNSDILEYTKYTYNSALNKSLFTIWEKRIDNLRRSL